MPSNHDRKYFKSQVQVSRKKASVSFPLLPIPASQFRVDLMTYSSHLPIPNPFPFLVLECFVIMGKLIILLNLSFYHCKIKVVCTTQVCYGD